MNKMSVLIVLVFILGTIAGYAYGFTKAERMLPTGQVTLPVIPQNTPEPHIYENTEGALPPVIEGSATINLLAVDNNGNGTAIPITVQRRAGYGETLIDIDDLVFWFDTQQSIQTAKSVAEQVTGADLSRVNLIYFIEANATLVGGPSAGGAITIATIAALENKTLNNSVVMTGTINPDGSIGQVGGVLEKAKAAKDIGAKLLLVPGGQATETVSVPKETCSRIYGITYCRTQYYQTIINVSEEAGIPVKEVSTIEDAERYFGLA